MNRRLMLVGLTVAATILVALPTSSASASVWVSKGKTVSNLVEIGLSGGEMFETTEGNGMSCKIHATLATEGGSTGQITQFEVEECPTGFGSFAGCELLGATALNLPWVVHVNASDLTITKMRVRRTFAAGCGTSELDKTIGSVTALLDNSAGITEIEFAGAITGYQVIGSLAVDAPNAGLYGIGA